MLKALSRTCWQHQIVHKRLKVFPSASNSDTLVDSVVIVLPVHRDQGSPSVFVRGPNRYNTTVRGPDKLRSLILSENVTFYQTRSCVLGNDSKNAIQNRPQTAKGLYSKRLKVYPAAAKSDTLFDSAITVFPIHIDQGLQTFLSEGRISHYTTVLGGGQVT